MRYALLVLLFLPFLSVHAQDLNAGFVKGIWYSKTPLFAQETVRIYTVLQNNSGADIEGKIIFLVNGEAIGESPFAAINGRIIEAWADWHVPYGTHQVEAHITEAVRKEIGKDPEPITLNSLEGAASEVFADKDTDQDGVGNLADEDDDNDGFTDLKEELAGTDPLDENSFEKPAAEPEVVKETVAQDSESPVTKFTKKITDEYLAGFGQGVDATVEQTIENLKEQRETLAEKPLFSTGKAWDFLLASAITALPEWRFGLFLFFGLGLTILARKLG